MLLVLINKELKQACKHKNYLYKQMSNNKLLDGTIRDYRLHMHYLNEINLIKTIIHDLMILKDRVKTNRG